MQRAPVGRHPLCGLFLWLCLGLGARQITHVSGSSRGTHQERAQDMELGMVQSSSRHGSPARRLIFDPKKHLPAKGDTNECASILARWKRNREQGLSDDPLPPCRDGDGKEIPPDGGTTPGPPSPVWGTNQIQVGLFVKLHGTQQSLAFFVVEVMTDFLSFTNPNFVFHLESRRLQTREAVEMFHVRTDISLFRNFADSKWWQHKATFNCFRDDMTPIRDKRELRNMMSKMRESLERGVQSGELRRRLEQESRVPILDVKVAAADIPGNEDTLSPDFVTDEPTSAPSEPLLDGEEPTFPYQLNTNMWDWHRYFGLGLFLGTVFSTCGLMHAAAKRQRRIVAHEVWGNLSTEEGVDELLRTGWKLRDGDRQVLEVYDKGECRYRDDDSLLIGGYEQREVNASKEIALTYPESELTP